MNERLMFVIRAHIELTKAARAYAEAFTAFLSDGITDTGLAVIERNLGQKAYAYAEACREARVKP